MGLDIRIPLGLIFLIIGAILTIFGAVTHGSPLYTRSLGIDVNLFWGILMLLFGGAMFFVGRHKRWQDDPVSPRPWEQGNKRPRH